MTNMQEFRFLVSVASGGSRTVVNGKAYAVAIYGVSCVVIVDGGHNCAGNRQLRSPGHIIDIQLGASGGTYVVDNGLLCPGDKSIQWSRRADSLLEFSLSAVCSLVSSM